MSSTTSGTPGLKFSPTLVASKPAWDVQSSAFPTSISSGSSPKTKSAAQSSMQIPLFKAPSPTISSKSPVSSPSGSTSWLSPSSQQPLEFPKIDITQSPADISSSFTFASPNSPSKKVSFSPISSESSPTSFSLSPLSSATSSPSPSLTSSDVFNYPEASDIFTRTSSPRSSGRSSSPYSSSSIYGQSSSFSPRTAPQSPTFSSSSKFGVSVGTPKSPVVETPTSTKPWSPPEQSLSPPSFSSFSSSSFTPMEVTVGSGRSAKLEEFASEVESRKKILLPYYKGLIQSKCQNIDGLGVIEAQLIEYIKVYNKFKPISGQARSEGDVDFALKHFGKYVESVGKVLNAMHVCYKKFMKEFVEWSEQLVEISKSKSKPTNFNELKSKTEESRQKLEKIAVNANKIRERKAEMDQDLKNLQQKVSQYVRPLVFTPSKPQSSPAPMSSPYYRSFNAWFGNRDTDFVYHQLQSRPKLRENVKKLIDEKDKFSLQQIVYALKIDDYGKKLRELGYSSEADAFRSYPTDISHVQQAERIYLRLAERHMLLQELSKFRVTQDKAAAATNDQLRNWLQQLEVQSRMKSSPRGKEDQKPIQERKYELAEKRGLANLDDKSLYSLTVSVAGADIANKIKPYSNRRDLMIEAIVSKELGLF